MITRSHAVRYLGVSLLVAVVLILSIFVDRAPSGAAPNRGASRDAHANRDQPARSAQRNRLPAKSSRTSPKPIDWSRATFRPIDSTPEGRLARLKWVEPPEPRKLKRITFMIDQLFERLDNNDIHQDGMMLEHARPISSREDAKARFLDCRIFSNAGPTPVKGFETPDYYVLTWRVPDYIQKLGYYAKKYPREEHPVCDFSAGGYAIRKSDGHAVGYSPAVLEKYLADKEKKRTPTPHEE